MKNNIFIVGVHIKIVSLLLFLLILSIDVSAHKTLDLSHATIVAHHDVLPAALFLKEEIYIRTGYDLQVSDSMPGNHVPAIILGTHTEYLLPRALSVPAKPESFAIWTDTTARAAPTVHVIGRDARGVLFGAGKLIRQLYLSQKHISIQDDIKLASAPADMLRAHQILKPQSNDNFQDTWNNEADARQQINDLVIFGTNGFEHRNPKVVDKHLHLLGLDLFLILVCQDIIDLDLKSDDELISYYDDLNSVTNITTYGGDASGMVRPDVFFPHAERVIPLVQQGLPGVKWWYSNQCIERHAIDYDWYTFDYIKDNKPSWLYGMVYGPWSKRGINEVRDDLPSQYVLRHYPDICHQRWSQYVVPEWDRIFAIVWPRNQSIYAMPTMMLDIYKATRKGTIGALPYSHTGTYNDLNKFVWSAAMWDPETDVKSILKDYARAFFAHDFVKHPIHEKRSQQYSREELIDAATDAVVDGLLLLERNWVGPLANNGSVEAALEKWRIIADCIGGAANNWRVEKMLYKARIDAQIKRKYDLEMRLESEAYNILRDADVLGLVDAVSMAKATLAMADTLFQTRDDFLLEISEMDLTSNFGDLEEITDNIYSSFNDRYWLESQIAIAETLDDIFDIIYYEDPGEGGFYDNLGVAGKQPHLVKNRNWHDDPGFVYSPIEWVDNAKNSTYRHSQHTHAVSRYDNPLIMRWEGLDERANYQIRVVYNGPWDPLIKCETDEGLLIHDYIEKANNEILTFHIPREATSGGTLQLQWSQNTDEEHFYRGVSVSEIWLHKLP